MDELNYRGVLSYERGGHLESLRVTHGVIDGEVFERLEHLDGEHREVIRRGKQLLCIQVDQRFSLLLHKHLLKAGLAGLDPYYDIQIGGESRVAGRRSIEVSIKPRDAYRFGYRLALDRETGFLLRSESLAADGRTLERLQFVDVEIAKQFKSAWLDGAAVTEPLSVERIIEESQMPWQPQWLPPGFTLAMAPHRPSEDVLTYSDGLAVLSIFIAPAATQTVARPGRASQGATVAFTRPAHFDGAPFNVTVVGEVPAATAQRVADSVSWRGAP
jgi:sigma-E factor negative regulatory protein RseB